MQFHTRVPFRPASMRLSRKKPAMKAGITSADLPGMNPGKNAALAAAGKMAAILAAPLKDFLIFQEDNSKQRARRDLIKKEDFCAKGKVV